MTPLEQLLRDTNRDNLDWDTQRIWKAMVLAPNLQVFISLLDRQNVPTSQLDPLWRRGSDMSDRVYLDDFNDIPDMSITEETLLAAASAKNRQADTGWEPVDLTDDAYSVPPDPPSLLGLIYTGCRHVLSGAPETAKTLVAYITIITAIRDGWKCAIIDFEMGPTATRRLLTELGATLEEIGQLYYVAPNAPPEDNLQSIVDHGAQLVVIDAAIGAYGTQGLDDNRRQDAEKFASTWVIPLWKAGIATLLIDHVTKNIDNRGKFTIGSERKLGSADVHLGLEAVETISRGGNGLIKVHVHKDRPAFLKRPLATLIALQSHPDTHHITWKFRAPQATAGWRPTRLMEKISRFLELTPSNRTDIYTHVTGKAEAKVVAVDKLLDENWCIETIPGKKGTKIASNRPYREEDDEIIPTIPDDSPSPPTFPFPIPPPTGGNGKGNDHSETPQIDVHDPAVQTLLDDYDNDIPF